MINKEIKRAALYARVSLAEEGVQDPENQLVPMREYCKHMGYVLIEEYIDRVSGGTSDRPAFIKMRKDMMRMRFDVLIVWSLDRFSRESMSNTLLYIEDMKHYRVGLKSLQESWLDTTQGGVGDLLIAVFSWVAQYERERIKNRTNAKIQKRKGEGLAHGRPRKKCPECKSTVEHYRRDGKLLSSRCLFCSWKQKRH